MTASQQLHLTGDAEADELLSRDALALLIGMLLDQQFPMERAFAGPHVLSQRLGHEPTAPELADFDPEALAEIFAQPPVIHRYPKSMATRVQALCRLLGDRYDGEAASIWREADTGAELVRRIQELPGFGKQKARIFVALLGKQYGVTPPGWREAAGPYGEEGSHTSIADVTGPDSLQEVRAHKRAAKAAAKGP
jgi:uncharacterized HhH-GPD family protein